MSHLFLSYSRKDELIVSTLSRLLATSFAGLKTSSGETNALIFQDVESMSIGEPWAEQVDAAIEKCAKMFVFWCCHSASSSEVAREYSRALSLGKSVIPVLMDSSTLPAQLAPIHGLDMRRLQLHTAILDLPQMSAMPDLRQYSPEKFSRQLLFVQQFGEYLGYDQLELMENFSRKA